MSSKPWFRMYTEIIDDEKLALIAFEDRWHYVAILSCKGKGLLDKEEPKELMMRKISAKLGLSSRELDEVSRRLSEVGLIDKETMQPNGWNERQYISDISTDRVKKHREKSNTSSMKRFRNVSETPPDTDTDTDTDTDKQKKDEIKDDFLEWYSAYPNKVGKPVAERAYRSARKKTDALTLSKALEAYIQNKPKDRPYCNPSTWLNQERWNDEPAETNRQTTRNGFGQIAERLDERSRTHEAGFLAFRGNGK